MARRALWGTNAALHRPRVLTEDNMLTLSVSAAVVVVLVVIGAVGYMLDRSA
jgi:hypothetical protein